MDTIALVEEQLEEGQALLDRLAVENIPVRVACWVKPYDRDRWTLYIATPLVDKGGLLAAYKEVNRVLRSLDAGWVRDSVGLIGTADPMVEDALEVLRRYPGRRPARARDIKVGVTVEEVYVYAPGKPVEVPIYGLEFRGDPHGTVHLSFEPHNPNTRYIVEDRQGRHEYPAETGRDWVVAAPEGSAVERDDRGLPVLGWDAPGRRIQSTPGEVLSLAKLNRHGFRVLKQPE